jgi:hypothetical protein
MAAAGNQISKAIIYSSAVVVLCRVPASCAQRQFFRAFRSDAEGAKQFP